MKTFKDIYSESATTATFTVGYGSVSGRIVVNTMMKDEQGGVLSWPTFSYDGLTGALFIGDAPIGLPGKLVMGQSDPTSQSVLLEAATSTLELGGEHLGYGKVHLKNNYGHVGAQLSAETCTLTLGCDSTPTGERTDGKIVVQNTDGVTTILMDGQNGNVELGGGTADGDLRLKTTAGEEVIVLNASTASVTLGGGGTNGDLFLKTAAGATTVALDAANAILTLGGPGANGDIIIKNNNDMEVLKIIGLTGDIQFLNADVAEEFEVAPECLDQVTPGTVVVLDEFGRLAPCETPYDTRVVGIVAGGGDYRPGIVLDSKGGPSRRAVALLGKTYCRVDADEYPVRVGTC